MTDYTSYIPHKICIASLEGVSNNICKECYKKFWFNIATHYGMSDKDAGKLIEGRNQEDVGGDMGRVALGKRTIPAHIHTGEKI